GVFREDTARGDIAGQESGMNAMAGKSFKRKRNDDADCLGHQALAGVLLAHPVAEVDVLRRTPADVGERDAADQRVAVILPQVDEEGVVRALARFLAAALEAGE